jgi:hypothetical protein
VTHALWENGNKEAFLKHVMAELSYVHKKGYIKEYEEAERSAGLAVHESRVREDLYMAAPAVAVGDALPELAICVRDVYDLSVLSKYAVTMLNTVAAPPQLTLMKP